MGKQTVYNRIEESQDCVSESFVPYGDINAMKVQLVNRIMRMDKSEEVLSVLDFVRERCNSEFEEEWRRSLSIEEFRCQCKDKLRKLYGEDGN
ncbi:MAG: hypothetical protein Q4D36_06980 [Bacteroidales bacterium]|nr:hypothetical protein [Bacteroidales bacterium]